MSAFSRYLLDATDGEPLRTCLGSGPAGPATRYFLSTGDHETSEMSPRLSGDASRDLATVSAVSLDARGAPAGVRPDAQGMEPRDHEAKLFSHKEMDVIC